MLVQFAELQRIRFLHKKQSIVMVGGCYDLLHVGHVAYLERCRELGDILVVATSSDERIQERKGASRPIIPEANRAQMLSALACVDYALVAPRVRTAPTVPTVMVIEELRPQIFATSDVRFHEYETTLAAAGTKVIYMPEIRLTSTTEIIERIRNRS